tara:strand:- start:2087 stop:2389 length:303 start_codon:yes stop_codon:yes gene_type:complete
MQTFPKNKQGGFIKAVIFVVIVLIILSYFGLNMKGVTEGETFQDNLDAAFSVSRKVYDFVKPVFTFLWEKALEPYIFSPIKNAIENRGVEQATSTIDMIQ